MGKGKAAILGTLSKGIKQSAFKSRLGILTIMDPMKLRRRINAIDIEILKILSRDSGIEITRLARVIGLSPLN